MQVLKGYVTIIGAVGAVGVAIKAFYDGDISLGELETVIMFALGLLGLRRAIANK